MNPIFLGNWKMNMLRESALEYVREFRSLLSGLDIKGVELGLAVPYPLIEVVAKALNGTKVMVGAQNCHWLDSGAHTGEISAPMLKELGATFALLGHSERRQYYGETDEAVSKRAAHVIAHGLMAVVCVGESRAEFESGKGEQVVTSQLRGSLEGIRVQPIESLVIAYEPVWAIGTGLAATPDIAENMHSVITKELCTVFGDNRGKSVRIIYGGSASPENIESLLSRKFISGALPGGASLKPDSFFGIVSRGLTAFKQKP